MCVCVRLTSGGGSFAFRVFNHFLFFLSWDSSGLEECELSSICGTSGMWYMRGSLTWRLNENNEGSSLTVEMAVLRWRCHISLLYVLIYSMCSVPSISCWVGSRQYCEMSDLITLDTGQSTCRSWTHGFQTASLFAVACASRLPGGHSSTLKPNTFPNLVIHSLIVWLLLED